MKPDIHPEYIETTVTCSCGNSFTTRSTAKNGVIHAEVCSACHPFYTGKQKILDTGGRVAKFEKRFGSATAGGNAKSAETPQAEAAEASDDAEAGANEAAATDDK